MAGILVIDGYEATLSEAGQDPADVSLGHVAAGLFDDCPGQLPEMQRSSVNCGHALGEADKDYREVAVFKKFVKFPKMIEVQHRSTPGPREPDQPPISTPCVGYLTLR